MEKLILGTTDGTAKSVEELAELFSRVVTEA